MNISPSCVRADGHGVWAGAEDYLIPNRRPASVRRAERSDKVIWETIKRVAARAGIRAHVHAFRAAFAVQFDEAHPDQVIALKELMGHTRIETTLVYLRRKDKARAMEAVRDLSWRSNVFPEEAKEAHTGFEPVPPP
jgi:site-specific recombinase XerD